MNSEEACEWFVAHIALLGACKETGIGFEFFEVDILGEVLQEP